MSGDGGIALGSAEPYAEYPVEKYEFIEMMSSDK